MVVAIKLIHRSKVEPEVISSTPAPDHSAGEQRSVIIIAVKLADFRSDISAPRLTVVDRPRRLAKSVDEDLTQVLGIVRRITDAVPRHAVARARPGEPL